MPQNNEEEFSVQEVFNVISGYLENEQLYERLLNILREDANYKRLLTTGEQEYLNGPSESTIAEETERSRSQSYGLNMLVMQVDNGIDKIVREKFQGEFLDKLKDEVLQAILLLCSKETKSSEDVTQPSTPITKQKRGRKKKALKQTKASTNKSNVIQNGRKKETTRKEASNAINGQEKSIVETRIENYDSNVIQNGRKKETTKKEASNAINGQEKSIVETRIENYDSIQNGDNVQQEASITCNEITRELLEDKMNLNDDHLKSLFSIDTISSVHTSDLSSFEDEISVSSDEDIGRKKRLSLKEVKEKLDKSHTEDMDFEMENDQDNYQEGAQSKFPVNINNYSGIPQKSPRKRKLNSKYFDDNIVCPIKRERASASSRSLCGDTPSKKARSVCGDTPSKKARSVCGDTPSRKARSVCGDTPRKRSQSVSRVTPRKRAQSVSSDTPRKRGRPRKYLK